MVVPIFMRGKRSGRKRRKVRLFVVSIRRVVDRNGDNSKLIITRAVTSTEGRWRLCVYGARSSIRVRYVRVKTVRSLQVERPISSFPNYYSEVIVQVYLRVDNVDSREYIIRSSFVRFAQTQCG